MRRWIAAHRIKTRYIKTHRIEGQIRAWGALLPVFFVPMLLVAACNGIWPTVPAPPQPPTPSPAAATPAPAGGTEEPAGHQLVVWLPQYLSVGQETRAGNQLAALFHQYEQANPGVRIDVQIKAEQGAASMSNYLRTAQRVAPAILPDVILIETQELWPLVDLGLLTEADLGALVPPDTFYPFALESVTYNGVVYGFPYLADIVHVAYRSDALETLPTTWTDLLESGQSYLFPAAGGDAFQNAHLLLQYVGAGGELLADGGVESAEALEALFTFLAEARTRTVIPAEVVETATHSASWSALSAGEATMAGISSDEFLIHHDSHLGIGFGPAPTREGTPVTIARVWALAVLTDDEDQRGLALALLKRMFAPEVHGPLAEVNRRLPTRRDALLGWSRENGYVRFLDSQLGIARSLPNGRGFANFVRRMQLAQLGVLSGELSPQDALLLVRSEE